MPLLPETVRLGLRELLAFYGDAGVDEPLEDAPIDRFAEAAVRAARRAAPGRVESAAPAGKPAGQVAHAPATVPTPPPAVRAAVPDGTQVKLAAELAAQASTLDELAAAMASFEGCNLRYTAKQLVFADGSPQAALMLVGEAPGRDEDLEGRPFVGRSGQLLDRMLEAIGHDRGSVYIANVIPWRPPGNRAPTPQETEICRPFITRQIELVGPKLLVTLGGPSTKTLLGLQEGMLRVRGSWRVYTDRSGRGIPAMPTLHPAYLLRTPAHKKLAWRDLLEIKARLRDL